MIKNFNRMRISEIKKILLKRGFKVYKSTNQSIQKELKNFFLISLFGIFVILFFFSLPTGLDLTKQALKNMSVNRTSYKGAYNFSKGTDNPYHIKTDKGGEDISWLL